MAPDTLLVSLWSMGSKWPMESLSIPQYPKTSSWALIGFKSVMYLLLQLWTYLHIKIHPDNGLGIRAVVV